jgi:hypothetical protein
MKWDGFSNRAPVWAGSPTGRGDIFSGRKAKKPRPGPAKLSGGSIRN